MFVHLPDILIMPSFSIFFLRLCTMGLVDRLDLVSWKSSLHPMLQLYPFNILHSFSTHISPKHKKHCIFVQKLFVITSTHFAKVDFEKCIES